MDRQIVSLHPFQTLRHWQIALECEIVREGDVLKLVYHLVGDLEKIHLPRNQIDAFAQRLNGLWESTCFECFLQTVNSAGYHEVNISPSGDWNIYAFDGYRSGMREEAQVSRLWTALKHVGGKFVLELRLPLVAVGLANSPLKLGLSAVIAHTDGSKSYWAVCHPGKQPDFHNDSCFVVAV